MTKLYKFTIVLLLTCSLTNAQNLNVTLNGTVNYPSQTCANVWGYVDSLNNEYALVGCSKGLSIVDVTNPSAPFQLKQLPGPNNLWKEIKTYGNYAYVTSEGGQGLQIVNLRYLPDSNNIPYKHWMPVIGTDTLRTIHALHIDTAKGYVYLYGSNIAGIVVADIKTDPWNPTYVGKFDQEYVHDGYANNDTVYAGSIYAGHMRVIDFTNKNAPVSIQTQKTPHNFTHNTWLSDDGDVAFTTDERNGSFVTAYNISDLSNIVELDRIRSNPGSNSVGHNTHVLNNYVVTSWYKDGFTIVDATRPSNLVQVGDYDTYSGSGGGFAGAWGIYPYFPSGTTVVSSMDGNLYVLSPTYVRACYLEGNVTDSISTAPLSNADIQILSTGISESSRLNGWYGTGTPTPGTYTIQASKAGYYTKNITGVSLSSGVVTNLNIELVPLPAFQYTGLVNDSLLGVGVVGAQVKFIGATFTYTATTNASGNFTIPNMIADNYDVIAGKWGYKTKCFNMSINQLTPVPTINLDSGYYDDFTFDFGWVESGNATGGKWERGEPEGTSFYTNNDANPNWDVQTDCGEEAYVTGNAGGAVGNDDVDNGYTLLTSPVFDLSKATEPYLYYYRWFFNDGGSTPINDSLIITLSNMVKDTVVEIVMDTSSTNSSWVLSVFKITDYLSLDTGMSLKVYVNDASPGHVLEAGFDMFEIRDTAISTVGLANTEMIEGLFQVLPNPSNGNNSRVVYNFNTMDLVGAELKLTNTLGQVVSKTVLTSKQGQWKLPEGLDEGIYFVTVVSPVSGKKSPVIKYVQAR